MAKHLHWRIDGNHSVLPMLIVLGFGMLPFLTGCGVRLSVDFTTSVKPLVGEDLAGPCVYDIVMPASLRPQQGVFVIYERGDSSVVFNDAGVREMAATIDFAMVFAHQCDAASHDDIQSDPTKGPGRALFTALDQFALATRHTELSAADVILYGFSAAGVLVAEMSSFAPARTLGVVAYAAGSAYLDLQTFTPASAALGIPTLFLDNSQDSKSGTYRSLSYFSNGRLLGARWGFGVQNGIYHCCNATTIPMLLPWVQAVGAGSVAASPPESSIASFVCSPDGVIDAMNDQNCSISAASLGPPTGAGEMTAWFPGDAASTEWLAWVTNPSASGN